MKIQNHRYLCQFFTDTTWRKNNYLKLKYSTKYERTLTYRPFSACCIYNKHFDFLTINCISNGIYSSQRRPTGEKVY